MAGTEMKHVLDGYKVLDFTQVLAGPTASRLLAEMGAEIIKAVRLLEEARIPVAPVLSIEQAVNHPHLRYRRTVRTITDRAFGELDIPGMPLKFSEFPNELPLQAPFLGEHNEEILRNYLSYSPEQIRALESEGVLKRQEVSN